MEYIHIKNLEKYHPGYKDRDLKWCKIYFLMINGEPDFEILCEIDKWRFIEFIMLELQIKKPIPLDIEYLKRKGFDDKKRSILLTIKMLQKFIQVVTEEEKSCNLYKEEKEVYKEEVYKEEKDNLELPLCFNNEEFKNSFKDYSDFRKKIRKPLTDKAIVLLLNKLQKLSNNNSKTAIDVMNQSIINGWTGVFELKDSNFGKSRMQKTYDDAMEKYGDQV